MTNFTAPMALPALPSYTLTPQQPLFPPIEDKYMSLILPIIAYWGLSMVFHYIDTMDYFPQYRLHTPAEVVKRNHVSRWEVVRDVVIQQVIQTIVGVAIAATEPDTFVGKDDFNVAVWAQRIRLVQGVVPTILSTVGVDSRTLATKIVGQAPSLAAVLMGGQHPWAVTIAGGALVPTFAQWELLLAKAIYWVAIPFFQFTMAILIVDTWQYFLHRAMHMNKWLYTTFHSRHHRLYVPYAYGALYNHPFEGFLLDTLGAGLAYLVTGLSPRQGMCFFTGSTIKTVDDHCGYALPWDPLQHLTSNNAGYHDVHHQSWGIKTNFSQPFFTFWDDILGTVWTGGDVSARYERARIAAQRKVDADSKLSVEQYAASSITGSQPEDSEMTTSTDALYTLDSDNASLLSSIAAKPNTTIPGGKAAAQAAASREQVLTDPAGGPSVLAEETAEEEIEVKKVQQLRRSPRKKGSPAVSVSAAAQAGSLKGLRDRVSTTTTSGFHGRTGGVLGYESWR